MGGLRYSVFVLVAAAGCQLAEPPLDLRTNPELYRDTGYRSRMQVDRIAFVTPLVDERTGIPVGERSPYPIEYAPDNVWPRPLLTMIEDILLDELRDSGVFAAISRELPPAADALVVQPVLMTARCAQEEHPFGRRSFAEFGLRLVVFGPESASGERPIWLQREFGELSSSDVSVHPPTMPKMLGTAVRGAMQDLLAFLDQSNVSRSGVPLAAGLVEASSDGR